MKRKNVSPCWSTWKPGTQCCERILVDGVPHIACNICGKDETGEWVATFAARNGVTSTANQHLSNAHGITSKKARADDKQALLSDFQVPRFTNKHVLWPQFTRALTYWVVNDLIPLNKLTSECFRKLWEVVGVTDLPQPRLMTDHMRAYADTIKTDLRTEIAELQAGVALTADAWTSKKQQGYLTITCHYIIRDWVDSVLTAFLPSILP